MESDSLEVCKLQVRKVSQDVQKFVWIKHEVLKDQLLPQMSFVPEVTGEFLKNLRVLVWIESACNEFIWEDFMRKHLHRMVKTPYLFSNYVAYASYLLIDKTTNVHECFLHVLSLVVHFTLHCWANNCKQFVASCVDLFCAFFDKELCARFEAKGRWKNFNKYLESRENFKKYKELINTNQAPYEIFKECATRHRESEEPSVVKGVVLKDITEYEVESDEKAVSFADSVADMMKEACDKQMDTVLRDFQDTDKKLEELYRKATDEASEGMASDENRTSSQKVQEKPLETVHSTPKPTKSKSKKTKSPGHSGTSNKDSLKSPKPSSASPKPGPSPKFNIQRAKALLNEMVEDVAKISELIKFVCAENEVQVPTEVGTAADQQ